MVVAIFILSITTILFLAAFICAVSALDGWRDQWKATADREEECRDAWVARGIEIRALRENSSATIKSLERDLEFARKCNRAQAATIAAYQELEDSIRLIVGEEE